MDDLQTRLKELYETTPVPGGNRQSASVIRRAKRARVLTALGAAAVMTVVVGGSLVAANVIAPATIFGTDPAVGPTLGPDPGDGVRAIGQKTVLEGGVVDGVAWKVITYKSTSGRCIDIAIGTMGSSGGCGFGRMRGHLSVSSTGWQDSLPSKSHVAGRVSRKVASVEARPDGGDILDAVVLDASRAGMTVNIFVAFVPKDSSGVIVARDLRGRVLQRARYDAESPDPSDMECCIEHDDEANGVISYYPFDWHRAEERLTNLTEPTEVLAVATYPLRPVGDLAETCSPQRALDDLGPSDAFVFVLESDPSHVRNPDAFPPRPQNARSAAREGSRECFDHPSWALPFRDNGRYFSVHVTFGTAASDKTKRQAWQVIDSLIIEDR